MNPSANTRKNPHSLHRCHILVDGSSHNAFSDDPLPDTPNLVSEALIPQIRTLATLIAAERHDFSETSPDTFTEEADFFAARILILGVRRFHLDITLMPMLKTANRRAQAFAKRHRLPFTPAEMHMSLHARRPRKLLIIETEHEMQPQGNIVADSLAFAASLPPLPL